MKLRTVVLLPVAVGFLALGSAIAVAQSQSPPTPPTATEIPPPPWARNLNLTAAQRSQLQKVNQQARQQGDQLHQQLMTADQKLRSLLQSNASIAQIRQQYQEVQKIRQQLDNNRFEALLAERQILTSEQLAQVIQQFKQRPSAP